MGLLEVAPCISMAWKWGHLQPLSHFSHSNVPSGRESWHCRSRDGRIEQFFNSHCFGQADTPNHPRIKSHLGGPLHEKEQQMFLGGRKTSLSHLLWNPRVNDDILFVGGITGCSFPHPFCLLPYSYLFWGSSLKASLFLPFPCTAFMSALSLWLHLHDTEGMWIVFT